MIETDIVIIGAGPIGMAMAAKLNVFNFDFLVVEKGERVGANLLNWGHVELFSTWNDNIDKDAKALLKMNDFSIPELSSCPTGSDLVEFYLKPLASISTINARLKLKTSINSIFLNEEKDEPIFELNYSGPSQNGIIHAKTVIDASGTWGNFHSIISAKEHTKFSKDIFYGIPNNLDTQFQQYTNKEVAVIGGGHSAMNSLQILTKLNPKKLHWMIRKDAPRFGKSKVGGRSLTLENNLKNLIHSGKIQLHKNFTLEKIIAEEDKMNLISEKKQSLKRIDKIIINAGASPDYAMIDNFNLQLDSVFLVPIGLADKVNPDLHTCGSVRYSFNDMEISKQDYHVVGMKSFGKASNFLLSSGYAILDELVEHLCEKRKL